MTSEGPGRRDGVHLPLRGLLRIGGWHIETFLEQRCDLMPPAEDILLAVVGGKVRIAVVDPALNAMLTGRERVAAIAWGRVSAELRSHDDLASALESANAAIVDEKSGWMGGVMLCIAVINLHPREPVALAMALAGDTEIHWEGGALSGSCFTSDGLTRLNSERRALGFTGRDPRRRQVQRDVLAVEDYLSTPLGLTGRPKLETWGAVRTERIAVTTDGGLLDSGLLIDDQTALSARCAVVPTAPNAFPHGDRAVAVARWVD